MAFEAFNAAAIADPLQPARVPPYVRPVSFDPSLPTGGEINKRWGVRMNVTPDELSLVGRT